MKPLIPILLAVACTIPPVYAAAAEPSADYLQPSFHDGERFDNVSARTVAIRAEGFDENVRRVSGSAIYRVRTGAAAAERLQIDYRYDGLHQGSGSTGFRDDGGTACFDGACHPNTDASGLVYNPRLWGALPASLEVGQHWTVAIASPWELGTPGRETVTVVALDRADRRVTLKREGEGDGAFLGDRPEAVLTRQGQSHTVTVQPGHAHWYGYTTFRRGVVDSDELMVERSVTLVSATLGHIPATERQFILLNAMPVPTGVAQGPERGARSP
jgi:hypothetical protein